MDYTLTADSEEDCFTMMIEAYPAAKYIVFAGQHCAAKDSSYTGEMTHSFYYRACEVGLVPPSPLPPPMPPTPPTPPSLPPNYFIYATFTSGASCEANGAGSIDARRLLGGAAALGLDDTTAKDVGQNGTPSKMTRRRSRRRRNPRATLGSSSRRPTSRRAAAASSTTAGSRCGHRWPSSSSSSLCSAPSAAARATGCAGGRTGELTTTTTAAPRRRCCRRRSACERAKCVGYSGRRRGGRGGRSMCAEDHHFYGRRDI